MVAEHLFYYISDSTKKKYRPNVRRYLIINIEQLTLPLSDVLLTHLGAALLLELSLNVGHSALNLLICEGLILVLKDEAEGV